MRNSRDLHGGVTPSYLFHETNLIELSALKIIFLSSNEAIFQVNVHVAGLPLDWHYEEPVQSQRFLFLGSKTTSLY